MDEWAKGWVDGQIDRMMDEWMDRWSDGPLDDGWTDRLMEK